jgi:hypothetical protein
VQIGEQVRFWEDVWLGDKPFREVYPNLYRIVRRKNDTVVNVMGTIPLNVSYRRSLVNANRIVWFDLVSKVVQVHLTNRKDVFWWNLNKNGMFTVRSMYKT